MLFFQRLKIFNLQTEHVSMTSEHSSGAATIFVNNQGMEMYLQFH